VIAETFQLCNTISLRKAHEEFLKISGRLHKIALEPIGKRINSCRATASQICSDRQTSFLALVSTNHAEPHGQGSYSVSSLSLIG